MTETRHTGHTGRSRELLAADERSVLRDAELRRCDEPHLVLRMLDQLANPTLRHHDPSTSGRASLLRAQVLGDLGQFDRAAGAVQAARHDFLAAGLAIEAFGADLVRSELTRVSGDGDRAVDIAQGVLHDLPHSAGAWRDREQAVRLRADVHLQLGLALASAGDHHSALRSYDVAWNRFHSAGRTVLAARTAAARASSYLSVDLTHRALEDLETSRRVLARHGAAVEAARCAIPLSSALIRLDRIPEAVALLEDVRPVFVQRGFVPDVAALDLATAEALLHAGLPHDARLEAQAAVDGFRALHLISGSSRARMVAGIAAMAAGDTTVDVPDLELAESLTRSPRLRQEIALVRLTELLTADEREVPERGRRLAALAHVAGTAGDAFMGVVAMLAEAYIAPTAPSAQVLLDSARRAIDLDDLEGLGVVWALVAAQALRRRGDLDAAADTIMGALTCTSNHGIHASGAYRPLAHLLVVAIADHALLDVLLSIGTPQALTDAWRWTAVTRSRSLSELGTEAASSRRPPQLDPQLPVHREAELVMLSEALDQLIDPGALVDLGAIRDTHVQVRRDIRQQIPHARLPLGPTGEILLPPVPEGPVLQLHVLDADVVAFVVREGQVYARRLVGATAEVEAFAAEWHAECSRVQRLSPALRGASRRHHSLDALGDLLLRPLEDLLVDLKGMPLVVVAPARLQAVPFEAITLFGRPFSAGFALRFAVGMHDLADESALDEDPTTSATSMLALMVPDATAPRITDETRALAEIHPDATILTGGAATVEAMSRLARHHDVLHLACHGLYWPEHPSSSGLRLGDRWVTAGEILRMDLRGCLVILNACATGRAHDTTSESIGLTWALLAAGARGVVATTWPVDDAVALAFATSFHRHLRVGQPPAHAVQEAGLELAERFSDHPWAWAAHRYVAAGSTVLHEV